MLKELDSALTLSDETKINLSYAGARLNANILMEKGWRDFTHKTLINQCAFLEFTQSVKKLKYQVLMALSPQLRKKTDDNGAAEDIALDKMPAPRSVYLRRIYIYVLDPMLMKYYRITDGYPLRIAEKIYADISQAIESQPRLFVDDLSYQTNGYQPFEIIPNLNEAENQLLILKRILEAAHSQNDDSSTYRLLLPIARTLLTAKDPTGFDFISQVSNTRVFRHLLESAYHADAAEVTIALFRLFLLNHANIDASILSPSSWAILSEALISYNLTECSQFAVGKLFAYPDSEEKRESLSLIADLIYKKAKRHTHDAAKLKLLSSLSKMINKECRTDAAFQLLSPTLDCHIAYLEKSDTATALKEIEKMLEQKIAWFDEEFSDEPSAKEMCAEIKAPLEWQVYIYLLCGQSDRLLQTLPLNINYGGHDISRKAILGLPFNHIWKAFLPENPSVDDCEVLSEKLTRPLTKATAKESVYPIEHHGINIPDEMEILEDPSSADTLTALAVKGIYKDKNFEQILSVFPFLPHARAKKERILVGSVWEYYPWSMNQGADARIRLENGDCIYATLPFYATDKFKICRGSKLTVIVCGFASALKKVNREFDIINSFTFDNKSYCDKVGECGELHVDAASLDWFSQDVYPDIVSRSGFSISGRVSEIDRINAFGVNLLSVLVDCRKLETRFEIIIPADKVESEIAVGDIIESSGWVYADFHDHVDLDGYKRENPIEGPNEEDIYAKDSNRYLPLFIRTDFTEEEIEFIPEEMLHPDWLHYAEIKLRSMPGVTKVVRCEKNPLHYSFLIRQNGIIRKIFFSIYEDNTDLKQYNLPMDILILRLIKHENGKMLKWEFIKFKDKSLRLN